MVPGDQLNSEQIMPDAIQAPKTQSAPHHSHWLRITILFLLIATIGGFALWWFLSHQLPTGPVGGIANRQPPAGAIILNQDLALSGQCFKSYRLEATGRAAGQQHYSVTWTTQADYATDDDAIKAFQAEPCQSETKQFGEQVQKQLEANKLILKAGEMEVYYRDASGRRMLLEYN